MSAQNLHLIQTHQSINMCNSYSVLRVCGKCFWEGCQECTKFCHEKLGCHGRPSTYSIPNQGKRKCPCSCSGDISTQTEAQDDKIEGSVPVVSQQGSEPCCSSHATAKGIVEILDKLGYDSDQEAIIKGKFESPANTISME